jgi:hypothetical protein
MQGEQQETPHEHKQPSTFHRFRSYVRKSTRVTMMKGRATIVPADIEEVEVSSDSDDSNYENIVAIDQLKAWKAFEDHLKETFGSLPKAFDEMDTSGDGQIARNEWMSVVTRRLRYCRASEALRLFDSKVKRGSCIKWEDLGITTEEWILYNHKKRLAEQDIKNRNKQMKPVAFGGAGMRRELAQQDHEKRLKAKPKKPPEAFWTTLPNGWGFPPNFIEGRRVATSAAENKAKSSSRYDSALRNMAWS